LYSGYKLWRLRLVSFYGYGLALAALALVLFGAYDSYPTKTSLENAPIKTERANAITCRMFLFFSNGCLQAIYFDFFKFLS